MLVVPKVADNHAPVAVDDSYAVHGCPVSLSPDVTVNDSDPDADPILINSFPQLPAHGGVSHVGNHVSYCANYAYIGSDSFSYEVCDNQNACTTGSVSLNVVNEPPSGGTDSYTVHSPATNLGPFLANDTDPDGDPVTVGDTTHDRIVQLPHHGGISPSNGGPNFEIYTANYGYTGPDSFTYNACDGLGLCTETTVNITVVNQPPDGSTDSYEVHGATVVGPFLINDSDPEGDALTCGDPSHSCILTFPGHGHLSGIGNQPDKELYGPNSGYTGSDSFTYNACDSLGLCTPTTVNLNINNNAPIAGDDSYPIPGPSTIIGPFLVNDSDPDGDALSEPTIVDFPQHGSLSGIAQPDKELYSAVSGFTGTDSFTYRICDDLGSCSIARVTLYVTGDGGNSGPTSCNLNIGGPVNVSNGNMYLEQSDYQLPSVGYGISVARTYNSDSQRVGLFGRGWSSTYDESIQAYDNSLVRLNQGDGRAIYLGRPIGSSAPFAPLVGDFHAQLTQGGNSFTQTLQDGSVRQFAATGKLLSLTDRNGNTTTLTYGANGFLSWVTDPFGRTLTLTTNANGQVTAISDSMGTIANYSYGAGLELLSVAYADNSAFHFFYDGNYRLTAATDALGNIVESHTYDNQGRAVTSEKQGGIEHYTLNYVGDTETDVTDALGRVTKYTLDRSKGRNVVTRVEGLCSCGGGNGSRVQTWTYDDQLNVTSKSDALGHVTSYTYDGSGNQLTQTDATGTVTNTYNGFAQMLTSSDQLNGVTTNSYDALGNLLTTINALDKTTSFSYDSRGLLLTVTDARGKVAKFAYDANGNLDRKTDALSHDTQFSYDGRARLISTTNALGHTTSFTYDAFGRLKQVTRPDGTTIGYEYDLAGRRTALTDAKGNRSTYAYDAAYRLIGQTDAANQTTSFGYDGMSNMTSVSDALSRVTNYVYDEFNRPVKITFPAATPGAARLFETLAYDAAGNVTHRTDTAGRVTSYAFDEMNRVTSTTDAANQTTTFEYDALSRMRALVDAVGQRYRFNYDALGQLKHIRRGTTVMSFTSDAVGNRKKRTDYNGALTTYTYDALNRLKTINYPDTTEVSYTYDKLSRMQTAANENGTVNFDYNKMNRLTGATDVFGQTVDYNYDDNGNRTKLSLNAAVVETYRYDAVDRLTKILDAAGAAFAFDYDATNKLTQKKAPNGVKTTYQYDGLNRLTRLLDARGVVTIADHQYQYSTVSQITQIAEPTNTRNYGYDTVNRLTSATYTNPSQTSESYAYDSVGNRTSSHLSASYSYQPFNRLTNTSTATYVYDTNGNLISKADSSGTTRYSWDFENRLKQVTLPNGSTVSYKYDALGRRIQRSPSAGISTNFVYDGQDVVRDLNSDGSTVDYLNGLGIDNKLRLTDSRLAATGPLYFSQDHLGSTTALTNSLGAVVSQVSYDGFGNSAGNSFTRYDYTGRERDVDTGLMYYRARWYDPKVGRFISEDPIGFNGGDVNIYGYVGSDPANLNDPSGQWSTAAHNYIIDQAFKNCLNKSQLQNLKDASRYVDRTENQDESHAYQHSMRGGPGESEDHARNNARTFVDLYEGGARVRAALGCKGGYDKISGNALWDFGQALHTITDSTSPSHENFQIWYGPPTPTGILPLDQYHYAQWGLYVRKHEIRETLNALKADPARLAMVKKKAREEFAKVFGDCGCCSD
jgi:RHS repeat-associated protein